MNPTPQDSRYVPLTQQPDCCVPTCIQMVMYRNGIPLRPAEEIGYHLGLVVAPERSGLFCNAGTVAERPTAGYGVRMHLPEYEPNAAFARMGIPLDFTVEPITDFPTAHELLLRLRAVEADDRDAIIPWNIAALLDDPSRDWGHVCVFDRVVGERVRLIDPFPGAPKWSTFDVERLFTAMQRHARAARDWAGIWLLSRTGDASP